MPLRKSRFEEMPRVSGIAAFRFNSEVWISIPNKLFTMQRACPCLPLVCRVCLRLQHVCPCQCAVLFCEACEKKESRGVFLGMQRTSGKAACFLNCRKQTVFCHDGGNSLGILEKP